MKVRVSLPEADVEFLDAYAGRHGCRSIARLIRQSEIRLIDL